MRGIQSSLKKSGPAFAVKAGCPKCGNKMRLCHIVPDKPGYDACTFECSTCGERVTDTVKT